MINFGSLFTNLQRGFLKNVLTGAGLTFITAGATLTLFNSVVQQFKNSLGSFPIAVLQLMSMAGFDVAFSIILGAISARYVQNSSRLYLGRK